MDDLAREMIDTITTCMAKGVETRDPVTGKIHFLLVTIDSKDKSESRLEIPFPDFCQPPVDFEKKSGLKNIAARYNLPEGIKPCDLQDYAQSLRHGVMRNEIPADTAEDKMMQAYHALVARNPQLAELEPLTGKDLNTFHTLMGVASGFNVKDIKYWLNGGTLSKGLQDPAYAENMQKADRWCLTDWAVSPETLQDICTQIDKIGPVRKFLHKLDYK